MTAVDTGKVLLERRGHVLLITLNRPEVRNAVDHDVCYLVGRAVEQAEADAQIRVIIITGSGRASFCAGADLKALAKGDRMLPEGMERWSFAGFVDHFTSKPTIAAVNGSALGGGTELALACDLVVAADTAVFGLPEVKRGLIAGGGGAFRIVEQLPRRVGMHLLLTGEPMSAADALRWGLINAAVPPASVLPVALELAALVASNAPLAVQGSKRIAYGLEHGRRAGESARWALTDAQLRALMTSKDAAEGPRAFAEKRAPVWRSC